MNTRQLLSVGIDIGTTTTQVIFSHLELVNRAAVSQVPRYEFIKREISWQSPVFFTPDKFIEPARKKRKYDLRMIWNAIFYLVKTGCQ